VAYEKNVSVSRLINHYGIGKEFARLVELERPIPDVILASLPTLELCEGAVGYGKRHAIPVILDLRDMWPDIFLDAVPKLAKPVLRLLLFKLFRSLRHSVRNADYLFGITPEFVDWGLKYADRSRRSFDGHYWLGYKSESPDSRALGEARKLLTESGVTERHFIVSYIGTMSGKLDMETVIEAARVLEGCAKYSNIRFVLAGSGDLLNDYKKKAKELSNVIFLGWVDSARVYSLLHLASVGLAPYRSRFDFVASLPIKAIEYLSAGLPVVSSLKGVLEKLIKKEQCGLCYENGECDGLISALKYLYDNPLGRERLSENSLRLYKREFMSDTIYSRMSEQLREIAESGRFRQT
jgi:glycosyltransferase involved in cell wall biosynthesis